MAKVQYYGTGRRKSSVARVRLIPGEGATLQLTVITFWLFRAWNPESYSKNTAFGYLPEQIINLMFELTWRRRFHRPGRNLYPSLELPGALLQARWRNCVVRCWKRRDTNPLTQEWGGKKEIRFSKRQEKHPNSQNVNVVVSLSPSFLQIYKSLFRSYPTVIGLNNFGGFLCSAIRTLP